MSDSEQNPMTTDQTVVPPASPPAPPVENALASSPPPSLPPSPLPSLPPPDLTVGSTDLAEKKGFGFLNPESVVANLGLKPGMVAADFGCGAGFFTIPMAKAVGRQGKLVSLDVQRSSLDMVRSKAKLANLLNIDTVWADLEVAGGSKIKDAVTDAVMVANILFQSENKKEVLREAFRVLKNNGRLVVVEWDKSETNDGGPPAGLRMSPDDAKKLAEEQGFEFKQDIEAGSHHYGFLFTKP